MILMDKRASIQPNDHKIKKDTLFSPTFNIEEHKVPLQFNFIDSQAPFGHKLANITARQVKTRPSV